MPQQAWSDKRERQYEHVKESQRERGSSEDEAEEIAARVVNKDRAQTGEAKQASRASTEDVSAAHRGGTRSGNRQGPRGRTKEQLYRDAQRAGISGRSSMSKQQLQAALDDR